MRKIFPHIWKNLILGSEILLFASVAFFAFPSRTQAFEAKNAGIEIKLIFDEESVEADACIEFQLTNLTKQAVYVWESTLPWSIGIGGARLVAIPKRASRTNLQQSFGLESGIGFSKVEAGETLKGKILLKERIPMLEVAREHAAVKLRWEYSLTSYASPALSAKKAIRKFRGVVNIHKRKSASKALKESASHQLQGHFRAGDSR